MKLEKILEVIDKEFKGKAIGEDGTCEYLTHDGKKCAVGLFIPNDILFNLENKRISTLLETQNELWQYMPDKDLGNLIALQASHDRLDIDTSIEQQKTILKKKATKLFGGNDETK